MVSQRYVITVGSKTHPYAVWGPLSATDAKRTVEAWRRRAPQLVFRVVPVRPAVFRDMITGT